MDLPRLHDSIKRHEGFRGVPYLDTKGKVTIGFGRNLTDNPLTEEEAWYLSEEILNNAVKEAPLLIHEFETLNSARQNVLIELVFNIGLGAALKFRRMRAALDAQGFPEAARQLLDSQWQRDVGPTRSAEMAAQLETGEWA
jgi:lysozyme